MTAEYQRKSKPRTENELLKYATTPAGAKRIKRAYRATKRLKKCDGSEDPSERRFRCPNRITACDISTCHYLKNPRATGEKGLVLGCEWNRRLCRIDIGRGFLFVLDPVQLLGDLFLISEKVDCEPDKGIASESDDDSRDGSD